MQMPGLTGCFLIFPGDAHGLWKFSHRNLSMAGPWAPPRTAPQRHQEPLPPLPRHSAPSLLGNATSEKYLLSSYCVPSARHAVFHRYNGPILQTRRLRFREGKELTLRERGSCPVRGLFSVWLGSDASRGHYPSLSSPTPAGPVFDTSEPFSTPLRHLAALQFIH